DPVLGEGIRRSTATYVCPDCRTPLVALSCRTCHATYDVRNGIPILLPSDPRFKVVADVAAAYDTIYRDHGSVWQHGGRTPQFLEYFSSLLGRFPCTRFLEIGCGEGLLLARILKGEKVADGSVGRSPRAGPNDHVGSSQRRSGRASALSVGPLRFDRQRGSDGALPRHRRGDLGDLPGPEAGRLLRRAYACGADPLGPPLSEDFGLRFSSPATVAARAMAASQTPTRRGTGTGQAADSEPIHDTSGEETPSAPSAQGDRGAAREATPPSSAVPLGRHLHRREVRRAVSARAVLG